MTTQSSLLSTDKKRTIYRKQPLKKRFLFLLILLLLLAILEPVYSGNTFLLPLILLLVLSRLQTRYRLLPERICHWCEPVWRPAVRRMRWLHIRQIQGEKTAPLRQETTLCKNCGQRFSGNYCPRCGQSCHVRRFNFLSILTNILRAFSRLANGFKRTAVELLWRPGYMMADFIKGKRIRYIQPFQMLFLLAAFYVLMAKMVMPLSFPDEKPTTEQKQQAATNRKQTGEKEDSFRFIDGLKTARQQLAEQLHFDSHNHPFLRYVTAMLYSWAHGNKAAFILCTLPLFAIASRLTFRWKKFPPYNTTEHLFIQTYIACQLLMISILLIPFTGRIWQDDLYDIPAQGIFLLFMWDYHELFCTSWWSSFWRTAQMFLYSLLLLMLLAVICTVLLVFYMEITTK